MQLSPPRWTTPRACCAMHASWSGSYNCTVMAHHTSYCTSRNFLGPQFSRADREWEAEWSMMRAAEVQVHADRGGGPTRSHRRRRRARVRCVMRDDAMMHG
eukprot:COSAG01_NODE_5258_length_4379_cov_23.575467_5_plen_101_part_00